MSTQPFELEHFTSATTAQAELRGIKDQPDRLARLHLVKGSVGDLGSLPLLREHLGAFLPDPEVIQAIVGNAVRSLVSIKKMGLDGQGKLPKEVLSGKNPPLEDLGQFIEGCKKLQTSGSVLPDLAGRGNLGTWEHRPVLLELNTSYSGTIGSEIPVNREGVPVWDESLRVLAHAEEQFLGRSPSNDPFYAALRDPSRQKEVARLWAKYKERLDEEKMC